MNGSCTPNNVPLSLSEIPNWVLWKFEVVNNKSTKIPYQVNGKKASSVNPKEWSSFNSVLHELKANSFDGIGFVFTEVSGVVGIDIDDCRDPITGTIENWALDIIDRFRSYTEISPSGKGIHVFVKGKWPFPRNRKNKIEVYNKARYFTVTGNIVPGYDSVIEERQLALDWIYQNYLYSAAAATNEHSNKSTEPQKSINTRSDDEIIIKCRYAKNRDKFALLYDEGNTIDYEGDDSRADSALCCLLAFYTRDCAQIDRIFRGSKLYRSKWERKDYRDRTIAHALQVVTDFYQWNSEEEQGAAKEQFKKEKLSEARELQEGTKDKYKKTNILDFIAKPFPPREHIIGPFVKQGLNMVFAPPGVGKTHFALGLSFAIATGGGFLNWNCEIKQRVIYIDGELPAHVLKDNLQALINQNPDTNIKEMSFEIVTPDEQSGPMPDLSLSQDQDSIFEIIGDAEFIVLDNLSTLCRTGDESKAEDWIPVQNWLLKLRRMGKSVLIVHHSGKGEEKTQRGTSKREDALDLIIKLIKPIGYKAEDGCKFEMKFNKSRHFRSIHDIKEIIATYTDFGWTVENLEENKIDSIQRMYSGLGMSQRDIAKELKIDKGYVSRIIKEHEFEPFKKPNKNNNF